MQKFRSLCYLIYKGFLFPGSQYVNVLKCRHILKKNIYNINNTRVLTQINGESLCNDIFTI